MPATSHYFDVIILGDEVESVITAVSAAMAGASVALVRRSDSRLGGLSVRGGLSYMDITPAFISGLFETFLSNCDVKRVALCPQKPDNTLSNWLRENNISVFSGVETTAEFHSPTKQWELTLSREDAELNDDELNKISCHHLIDSTPDADCARGLGIPYTKGLGGVFENDHFIGVSPVFQLSGVSRDGLIAFEATLRQSTDLQQNLTKALPHHPPELIQALIDRPVFSPEESDYIDILNPIIGIAFHHWLTGEYNRYDTTDVWIDGFNIARLPDEILSCNGLVMRGNCFTLDELISLSQERGSFPKPLTDAMAHFERFLKEVGGFSKAKVIPPESLYIRQTINIETKSILSAKDLLAGGVAPKDAIGSFSYWIDLRGIEMRQYFHGESPPKPTFNIGLDCALPDLETQKKLAFDQLAVVSRAGGYSPLGQGACRIVQHNAILGEAVGIAAALATQNNISIQAITPDQVRSVIKKRHEKPVMINGHQHLSFEVLNNNPLIQKDAKFP